VAQGESEERGAPRNGSMPAADAEFLARLREGEPEAGRRFVQENYPGVYRYLLYLTGHRETAEDLAQETFLQAWRHLDQFQGRASLQFWLHRIARREFLRARQCQRTAASLEEVAEVAAPSGGGWTDDAELRMLLSRLPEAEREVVILHDLVGYSSAEISRIVQAPASTIRTRLGIARTRLQRELGEGDLAYLNEPIAPMRQWAWLPLDQMHALESRLVTRAAKDRAAPGRGASKEKTMERRAFLRHAVVGAAGLVLPEPEKEVVDGRLTQKVTLALKGTALSDLCEHLRSETGVHLAAGASVADEKVTLFCEKLPLRDVMRQLSRPFGYTWLRSSREDMYRYELVQDLRSQLLEEELRNRDRNAALLALEKEIERFRPYLSLSPDEALAKAKTAPEAEKPLLEKLAGVGWGPIQMYFRLSPQQHAALRAGEILYFHEEPGPGQYPLPKELPRGVLECNRTWRVIKRADGSNSLSPAGEDPKSVPLTAVPDLRAQIYLTLSQSELGQFTLGGASGVLGTFEGSGPYAVSMRTQHSNPEAGSVNPKLARDPALRQPVSVQPQPSCALSPGPFQVPASRSEGVPEGHGEAWEPKVTIADALEALHQATRLPIIADFYTRLFKPEAVSARNQPLFEALNQLAQSMGLRWNREGEWLQFRSTTYYHDRLKEVPNLLLSRWASARRRQGMLTLDQIVEIAQLTDDQLDGDEMREGAIECWGLKEWHLLQLANERAFSVRGHLRFLAEFTPDQRQAMMSAEGLPFTKMSLAQQQGFLSRALQGDPLQSLDELAGATLRVDYTQPGYYQWIRTGDFSARRWVVPVEPGPKGRRVLMPPVRERTPEEALQAARRAFPPVTEAMLEYHRTSMPDVTAEKLLPQPEQIAPTELDLVVIYIPGTSNAHVIRWVRPHQNLGGL
jgi:RNA polymerase sigma-70 factor, ECF subfamily